MSDKSSIIVRYNLNLGDRSGKGFIVNHYHWCFADEMISRVAQGIQYFIACADDLVSMFQPLEQDRTYIKVRRAFDVDFETHHINVSDDGVTEVKKRYNDGEIEYENINDELFWCDTTTGQVLVDITNTDSDFIIKYAYVRNIYDRENIMDAEAYMKDYRIDDDERLFSYKEFFRYDFNLMTREEVEEFINTSCYDYIYDYEIKEKEREIALEEERKLEEQKFSDPEKRSEVSLNYVFEYVYNVNYRTKAAFARNKIRTVGETLALTPEQFLEMHIPGAKTRQEMMEFIKFLKSGK